MTDNNVTTTSGDFEDVFRQMGIPFELVPEMSIDTPVTVQAVQVRLTRLAPADRVARYYEQMKAGKKFPPITVRKGDFAIIDGNTRVVAAAKLGLAQIPAYLVEPRNDKQALELGGALNQLGGKDLDDPELRRVCVVAAEHLSAAAISKIYGVSQSRVQAWTSQQKTIDHARRLGMDHQHLAEELSGRQQELASRVINDRAFRELVDAMTSTEPVGAELNSLVKTVAEAPSEDEAVQAIRQASSAWPTREGDRSSSRAPALGAAMPIGALVKHDPQHWVDLQNRDTLLPKWEKLADLVAAVIAAYRTT